MTCRARKDAFRTCGCISKIWVLSSGHTSDFPGAFPPCSLLKCCFTNATSCDLASLRHPSLVTADLAAGCSCFLKVTWEVLRLKADTALQNVSTGQASDMAAVVNAVKMATQNGEKQ